MPQLVSIGQTASPDVQPEVRPDTGSPTPSDFGAGIAAAATQAGGALADAFATYGQEQAQIANFNRMKSFNDLQSNVETQLATQKQSLTDGQGFSQQFMQSYDKQATDFLSTVPPGQQAGWSEQLASARKSVAGAALETELGARHDYYQTQVGTGLQQFQNKLLQATDPTTAQSIRDQGTALINASGLSANEKLQQQSSWNVNSATAYGQGVVQRDPNAAAGALGADTPYLQNLRATDGSTVSNSSGYFDKLHGQESGSLPANVVNSGVNGGSHATGTYQFEPATWAGVVNSPQGQSAGLTLAGITDNNQQEAGIRILTAQNATELTQSGIAPSEKNLYMAHFLGASGAGTFIGAMNSNASQPAANVPGLAPAAQQNPTVFYNPDGTPKTLAAVYADQTQRFANSVPTTPGSDPVLSDIPEAQRLQLGELATNRIKQNEIQSASLQSQQSAAAVNNAQLGAITGGYTQANLDADIKNGVFTQASDIDKVHSTIDTYQKGVQDLQTAQQRFLAPGMTWNAYDPTDKAQINLLVKSLGNTPQAAFSVWDKTGVMTDSGTASLQGGLNSTDPAKVEEAANIAGNMIAKQPNAFAGTTGQVQVEQNAATYNHLVNDLGMSGDDAARQIAQQNTPEAKGKLQVADDQAKQFTTDLMKTDQTAHLVSLFNPYPLQIDGRDNPMMPAGPQRGALLADYSELAQQGFKNTGDEGQAKAYADQQIQKLYGVSNGNLTKFPPEHVYPPTYPVGGDFSAAWSGNKPSWSYIYQQAADDVNAHLAGAGTVKPADVQLLPAARGVTAQAWSNGQPAPYQLFYSYTNNDGQVVHDTIPGKLFVADPKAANALLPQERAAAFAKARATGAYLDPTGGRGTLPTLFGAPFLAGAQGSQ